MYKSNFEYDLMLCVLESSLEEDFIALEALENETDIDDVLISLFVLEAEGVVSDKLGKVKEVIKSIISKAIQILSVIFKKASDVGDKIDKMYTDLYQWVRNESTDNMEINSSDVKEIVITEYKYRQLTMMGNYLGELQSEYEKAMATFDTEKMRQVQKDYRKKWKEHKVTYFKKKVITVKEALDIMKKFDKDIAAYRSTVKKANKDLLGRLKNADSLAKKVGITLNAYVNAVNLVARLLMGDVEYLLTSNYAYLAGMINRGINKGRKREKKLAKAANK